MTGGFFRQDTIVAHFKYSEKYARIGLEIVNETNELLMEEFVKAGADGFFLGYQAGMAGLMGKEMFEEYGKKYDIQNINKIKDKTWFNMAHICHGDASAIRVVPRLSGRGLQLGGSVSGAPLSRRDA